MTSAKGYAWFSGHTPYAAWVRLRIEEMKREYIRTTFYGGQAYSNPERESDPYTLPDLEVFHIDEAFVASLGWDDDMPTEDMNYHDSDGEYLGDGWYYWYCLPGCLPDSTAFGPYTTPALALIDAREDIIW